MSKPLSGHFSSTIGEIEYKKQLEIIIPDDIIKNRVNGLDLREHPIPYKLPSKNKLKKLKEKEKNKTLSYSEYKYLSWYKRFEKRRSTGINAFWNAERKRIKNEDVPSRNWSPQQIEDILNRKRPKFKGKPIQTHHTFSASKYPHLANKGEILFPATAYEHLYGWHGGNYKKSLPGKQIIHISEF